MKSVKLKINLKLLFVAVMFNLHFSRGQSADATHKQVEFNLLSLYGDSMLKANSDSSRNIYGYLFKQMMDSITRVQQSFSDSFGVVKNMSVLNSDDNKVRVYTWMVPSINKMQYDFFGYVQVMNEKKKMKVYELREKKYFKNEEAEFLRLGDSAWFGALYYKLLHKHYDQKDQYILLGWQGKDVFSTRKVMDCLVISPAKIEFGKPVFKSSGKARSRVILEYNAQANVSMNYHVDNDMIIQDHLAPSDPRPEAKGMFSLYGPDLSYDGWKFKEGIWYLQSNVIVKNFKEARKKDVKLRNDLRLQRKAE